MPDFLRNFWRYFQAILGVIFRHPITGVSIIPVLEDGSLVLVRRRDTGKWGLPGGFVDWGEDIPQTVSRELEEETGLSLLKISRLVGVYSAPDRDPRVHSICVVVEALVAGEFKVIDRLEISETQSFLPEQIPLDELSHDHGRQLQDYLNGKTTLA
jgi:ADP-ribose pyrophosphatase YjhB (NUDIX family)